MPTGLYYLMCFLHLYTTPRLQSDTQFIPSLSWRYNRVCVWTEAITICFMYAYIQRVSRNMSSFGWLLDVSFESKISTGLVVTRQFLSHRHVSNVTLNVTYKIETFLVRNILLRSLFTCVCVTPCSVVVAARKGFIVRRCLSRVSIFNPYTNYAIDTHK